MVRNLIQAVLILGVVAIAIIIGVRTRSDWGRMADLARSAAQEKEIIVRSVSEQQIVDETASEVGTEEGALPDSVRRARIGVVMKRAHELAKRKGILDAEEKRARTRMEHFETQRAEIKSALLRFDAILGGLGLALIAGLVALRRFPSGG